MARTERPLDPDADPVQAFAADLRHLRERAGRPTYQAMARRAHRSSSSLSEAAGGRKLPTLDTTLAYVRALGGDEAAWTRRWREVAAATPDPVSDTGPGVADILEPGTAAPPASGGAPSPLRPSPAPFSLGPSPAEPPAVGPPPVGRPAGGDGAAAGVRETFPVGEPARAGRSDRRLLLPAAGAGLLVVLAVGLASIGWRSADRPPASSAPTAGRVGPAPTESAPAVRVRDGADPKDAGCAADPAVATVDSTAVLVDERVIGLVELRYSPACGASWPRFMPAPTGAPTVPRPARVVLAVTDGDTPARSHDFTIDYAGISAYGNLLTSTRTCVWAEVRITGAGWTSPPARTGCYRGATQVRPIP
ncbi:XRE family transcriptional regulator [Micromonospora rifamycinica]|uniref:helix-turn-helix domain-containing protein n=1 Tax=Micromonospora rifamycinica TaxID=291594 RepID=UPI002E2B180D|nr:helix-turn-helix domain-containing protein [Micromonospora rifamycinica]